jgi:hypothetical protein
MSLPQAVAGKNHAADVLSRRLATELQALDF